MNAYLLNSKHGLYLVFGEDAEKAGNVLAEKLQCSSEEFGVGGSWPVDPAQPINVSKWWPYFTATPSKEHTE